METDVTREAVNSWLYQVRYFLNPLFIAWIVAVINFGLLGKVLNRFGLTPRTLIGLPGILFSPFLHADWRHLEGNTLYYLIFGGLVFLREPSDFLAISTAITLIGGFALWLIGRSATYVGASGVLFGYVGFSLSIAYFERNLASALVLVLTVMLVLFTRRFGNTLWNIFPLYKRVAWDGHLLGLLTGIFVARELPTLRLWFERLVEVLNRG
jgi:membrane associated rhomboid family serine protease